MREITVYPPVVSGQQVRFRWQVDPPTELYRVEQFTLHFPEVIDLARVPAGLWWRVALLCLHGHWPLLRPCRVRLPVRLGPGEAEFWCRLTDAAVVTLEAHRGGMCCGREIEIRDDGPALMPPAPLPDTGRCATAFSGGKDSLLQAGLLAELTEQPVLVATTSPLPGLNDHATPRRRQIFRDIVARREVAIVEVESDFRACWDNDFSRRLGYGVSVNELTDSFLYFANLLAAGAAVGATHLFLASESEVQENVVLNRRIVQHPHCMYSAVTQRALQALLKPWGFRYGSLTSGLHSAQVQRLLWTRYADLRDLQYSCWRVAAAEAACSRCSQCLRIALTALALGDRPGRMGIDLTTLLREMRAWHPRVPPSGANPVLPNDKVRARLHRQVVRDARAVSLYAVLRALALDQPRLLLRWDGWDALEAFWQLRRRLSAVPAGPAPGFRAGYLNQVDPLLRDRLAGIFREHFRPSQETAYAGELARGHALTRWITKPIGGEERTASGPIRRAA